MNQKHYFLFIIKNILFVQFSSCHTSDENFQHRIFPKLRQHRLQGAIVDYRQPYSRPQVTWHSRLQVVDYRQPQQTTGNYSRLQVAIVDYRQPLQTARSHSRLQVAIVDCIQVAIVDYWQAFSYSYRKLRRHSSFKWHMQVMHLHVRAGILVSIKISVLQVENMHQN